MTSDDIDAEFAKRQTIASTCLAEPISCWWLEHESCCPATIGGKCDCGGVLYFGGIRRVVSVDFDFTATLFTKV